MAAAQAAASSGSGGGRGRSGGSGGSKSSGSSSKSTSTTPSKGVADYIVGDKNDGKEADKHENQNVVANNAMNSYYLKNRRMAY